MTVSLKLGLILLTIQQLDFGQKLKIPAKVIQGFMYWKKSVTFPKPKFKMDKLCQSLIGIYSKFGQYHRYDITMYDLIHIILFLIPIWSWISKMMLANK